MRPILDHTGNGSFVIVKVHWLVNELFGTERKRAARILFTRRRTEYDNRRFVRMGQRKHRVTRYFGDVQIKNDEIGLEIPLFQHLQRLFTVASDMQVDLFGAFREGLPDEKRISGVVFDKKHFGGVHIGTRDEESSRKMPLLGKLLNM